MTYILKSLTVLCIFLFVGAGCETREAEIESDLSVPTLIPTESASLTPTIFFTATPVPSDTVSPTATATQTAVPTNALEPPTLTPTPTMTVPVWVAEGTAIPETNVSISPENADQLTEIARWGRGVIHDVALSEDGRWLAVSTATGIYLHNAQDLNEAPRWIETDEPVDNLAFSPDSSLITAVSPQDGVHIWQVEDGEHVLTIPERAEGVVISSDGQFLAILMPSYLHEIQLWSLADAEKITDIKESSAIAFSSSGDFYAVASDEDEKVINIYQLPDHELINVIEVDVASFKTSVNSMAFSKDDQALILGKLSQDGWDDSGSIEVRQIDTGDVLYTIPSLAPRRHRPYFCDSQFTSFEPYPYPTPVSIEVSPDGQQFTIIYEEENVIGTTVVNYRLADGTLLHKFKDGINSLAYSPDGRFIITGSEDGNLYVWQADTFNLDQTVAAYNPSVLGIAYSPDGQMIAIENQFGVQFRDAAKGVLLDEFPTAVKVAFSPDGTQWALGYQDGHIEVTNAADKSLAYQITVQTTPVENLAFTPDNQRLIATTLDCTKNVYQAIDGTFLHSLEDYVADVDPVGETRLQIGRLAISNDSSKIVSGFGWSPYFGLWQTETGKLLGVYPEEEIAGVGHFIAVPGAEMFAGFGGTSRAFDFSFWDMNDASLIFEWSGPDDTSYYYRDMAITPEGNLLVASTNEGTFDLWQIDTQELKSSARIDTYLQRVNVFFLTSLSFSPNGRYLAAGTSDGLIHLWAVPEQ